MDRTEALAQLRSALPADPEDHGPVAVPSDAIRMLTEELVFPAREVTLPPVDWDTVDATIAQQLRDLGAG